MEAYQAMASCLCDSQASHLTELEHLTHIEVPQMASCTPCTRVVRHTGCDTTTSYEEKMCILQLVGELFLDAPGCH